MNFSIEEMEYFSRIVAAKDGIASVSSREEVLKMKKELSVCTGVNLWLMTNSPSIQTLEDFRIKLDCFTKVLSHPLYIEMEGNLYTSSTINDHLDGLGNDDAYDKVMKLLEYDGNPTTGELVNISKTRYMNAENAFKELKDDGDVKRDASMCGFTMNFQFSGDYRQAGELYLTVSSFCGVSDELEQIYERKFYVDSTGDLAKK